MMSLTEGYETMEGVLQMRLAQPSDRVAVARVVDAAVTGWKPEACPLGAARKDDLVAQCDNP